MKDGSFTRDLGCSLGTELSGFTNLLDVEYKGKSGVKIDSQVWGLTPKFWVGGVAIH